MGACTFRNTTRAYSMKDAYSQLVEDAIEEHGNDSYNGTISTTQGFKDYTREFKASKLTPEQFIVKYEDQSSKWGPCIAVCLEEPVDNPNKIKTAVEHFVTKGTRKWELKYAVRSRNDVIGNFNTKADAIKRAREYTEKTKERTQITVEKISPTNTRVAEITYKSSDKQKPGRYLFFGWAAE